jgi:dihydroorotate dehydrogenase
MLGSRRASPQKEYEPGNVGSAEPRYLGLAPHLFVSRQMGFKSLTAARFLKSNTAKISGISNAVLRPPLHRN